MGNIVKLLSLVYERECIVQANTSNYTAAQKKIRLIGISLLIILVLSASVYLYMSIKEIVNIVYLISSVLCVVSIIGLIKCSIKQSLENCQDDKSTYYIRLNLLKNKMQTEFNIYSKDKILKLLEECDNVIIDISSRNKIIEKFKEIWKGILAPIVGFVSALIASVDNLSENLDWSTLVLALVRIAGVILIVFVFLWGIEYISNMFFKDEKRRIIQLKYALNDIYLKNFI